MQSQNCHFAQYWDKMKRYSLWKLKEKMNQTNEINLESNVIQRKISVNILAALPFLSILFIHINLWCIKIMATKKKSVYSTNFTAPIGCWNFNDIYSTWLS